MKEKKDYRIEVISTVMGSGKTTQAIKMMNHYSDNKFIYVTPILTETDRIRNDCSGFYSPREGFKRVDFINMVKEGKNVSTTHSLFSQLEMSDYSWLKDYILVLDEVTTPVKVLDVSKDDARILLDKKEPIVRIDENNTAIWLDDAYSGTSYKELKKYIDTGNVSLVNGYAFVWSFPIEIFNSFGKVFVMTYQFTNSLLYYYFRYHNLEAKITFTDAANLPAPPLRSIKSLIDVYEGKYNKIGNSTPNKKYPLSATSVKSSSEYMFKKMRNNIRNFFATYCKTHAEQNMFTCIKGYNDEIKDKISDKGYASGFVSLGTKATNDYSHKTSVAFIHDIHPDPAIVSYFSKNGISINKDGYALAEMLQWIWRSAIRNDEPIKLFIPSERMRNLLENWLNGKVKYS